MEPDRRQVKRSLVATDVYLEVDGVRQRCQALNLSELGVFVAGEDLALEPGRAVALIFPVPVRGLIRLHRKRAVVAHVARHGIGMRLEPESRRPI